MGEFTASKRRRLLEPEEPHGGAGGEAGGVGAVKEEQDADDPPDLISRLPDDVLGDIISLLPTAAGGRTQVLSRRWLPLWRSSPLNLEARVSYSNSSDDRGVAAALAAHAGGVPARRFSLTWDAYSDGFPAIDGWLRSPTLDGLRELELFYHAPNGRYVRGGHRHTPLPLPVLRFSATLRTLCISCDWCRIDIIVPGASAGDEPCPHLEQLTFKGVDIAESTLHGILAGSPVLKSLMLHYNIGYRCLRIRSETLWSVGMMDGHKDREGRVEEVIVEDAPMLERLIPDGLMYHLEIRVLNAPKLKILGYLYSHVSVRKGGRKDLLTRVFKGMELASLTNAICTVKTLAINEVSNLGVVVDFLRCFPCVEMLHIVVSSVGCCFVKVEHDDSLECLNSHLKTLQLTPYDGNSSQVNLIQFFLSEARVLESVKLVVSRVISSGDQWIASERKKLMRLENRASQGARFAFEHDRWPSDNKHVPMKHIHDLALDNPFDRSVIT
ncbi:unnamed protein product [Urochloa humidicola]